MKLLKVVFEDCEFKTLQQVKLKSGKTWRDFLLSITTEELK